MRKTDFLQAEVKFPPKNPPIAPVPLDPLTDILLGGGAGYGGDRRAFSSAGGFGSDRGFGS